MVFFIYSGSTKFPVSFSSACEGHYKCHILMRSGHDVRHLVIEATTLSKQSRAQIEFNTHATLPLTQNIPVVSEFKFAISVYMDLCIIQ